MFFITIFYCFELIQISISIVYKTKDEQVVLSIQNTLTSQTIFGVSSLFPVPHWVLEGRGRSQNELRFLLSKSVWPSWIHPPQMRGWLSYGPCSMGNEEKWYRWRFPCCPGAFTGPLGMTGSWAGGREMAEHSRLSRTKAQSHSRVSLLCSRTRSRPLVSRAGMWRSLGQLIEKVNRDKMLQGLWHKQRRLCLSWNVTGNYRGFLGSLTILSPLRKMMGWTLTLE